MADMKPFQCIRPNQRVADRVAALPYDVYNREEAKLEVEKEPLSFLKIDRADTQFDKSVDMHDPKVYAKAKKLLEERISDGTFIVDKEKCYYIYELTVNGRSQTGITACASVDDYVDEVIKKHEDTREDKEMDRIIHVNTCNAQTGPIFLAYRSKKEIDEIVNEVKREEALYDFTATDGVRHTIWRIADAVKLSNIEKAFASVESVYIADGHHRAASAVKVGLNRRIENPEYTGEEEFNYFLSVLFPHDQLMIMDYNRTIKDLNGYTKEEFLERVKKHFIVTKVEKAYHPEKKGTFGMFLDKEWYRLEIGNKIGSITDEVKFLDVSILQDYLLEPILGIVDPRIDKRIDFVGGIRGLEELEKRANTDMKVSFSMYPTSIIELFSVADSGKRMPPKSTWFEPKLRSGLFIHQL